jgi:hypothetical protein
MRSYTTHERKGSSRASEAAIVYTAPYFAKENYTRLDKFSYFRNEEAEIDTAGVLSVLPTATVDNTRLAITNNTEVSATVLQNAANFFAEKLTSATQAMPATAAWIRVTFGDGVFVAVAQNSTIAATSPDGIVWTQRVLPVSAAWLALKFGNGVFLLIAQNSTIAATSTNGVTWTQRVLPVSAEWRPITFGNGLFCVAGTNSTIAITSPDGIAWTQRVLPVSANWLAMSFGENLFVIVGPSTTALTSPDCIVWTQRTTVANGSWQAIDFGNETFVAVGDNYAKPMWSKNGIDWFYAKQFSSTIYSNWLTICFIGDAFYAVRSGGEAEYSRDGDVWTDSVSAPPGTWLVGSAYDGINTVVVVGYNVSGVASSSSIGRTVKTGIRITETPTLTLPANHSYFVKIT